MLRIIKVAYTAVIIFWKNIANSEIRKLLQTKNCTRP